MISSSSAKNGRGKKRKSFSEAPHPTSVVTDSDIVSENESEQEAENGAGPSTCASKPNVWEYFDKINKTTAKCKLCSQEYKTADGSISGIKYHLYSRHGKVQFKQHKLKAKKVTVVSAGQTTLKQFISQPNSVSKEKKAILDDAAVDAIIKDSRPFGEFQKTGMLNFLAKAVPGYKGISRHAVARKIRSKYNRSRINFKQLLENCGSVSFTTDIWTSNQKKSYMVTTIHWSTTSSTTCQIKHSVIDFFEFRGQHTGNRIMQRLFRVFSNFGILEKIIACTTDSGANVKKGVQDLKSKLRDLSWLPCMAHTLHLVICSGLKLWNLSSISRVDGEEEQLSDSDVEEKEIGNPIDDFNSSQSAASTNSDCEAGSDCSEYNSDIDYDGDHDSLIDEWANVDENDLEEEHAGIKTLANAVQKLRKTVKFFSRSTRWIGVLRERLDNGAGNKNKKRIPEIDCKTRWNSTFDMVSCYLNIMHVISEVMQEMAIQDRRLIEKVENMTLSASETSALVQVRDILQPFKKATVLMSASDYPTIAMSMTILKVINEACSPNPTDQGLTSHLKNCLNHQLTKRFYDPVTLQLKTDMFLYEAAAYVDPRYYSSLTVVERQAVERKLKRILPLVKSRSATANIVEGVCETDLSSTNSSEISSQLTETSVPPIEAKATDALQDLLDSVGLTLDDNTDCAPRNELEVYKSCRSSFNPKTETSLNFWKRLECMMPELAKYAKTVLTIPLTSVASETAFSQSSYIVRKQRVRLSGETVSMLMFLKDKDF